MAQTRARADSKIQTHCHCSLASWLGAIKKNSERRAHEKRIRTAVKPCVKFNSV